MPESSRFSRREFTVGAVSAVLSSGVTAPPARSRPRLSVTADAKPAILGGTPIRTRRFPSWPQIGDLDEQKFLDSLREKQWCRLGGNITTQFEEKWAGLLKARHAIAVVNGTSAIYAALYCLDVGPGDEVLVPPYTFVATVNAVVQQYALPVFVDSDINTHLMDTKKLQAARTANTRCVLPVHLGGNVTDMDGVKQFAAAHGISVVEDACQAHFAEWNGQRVGPLGDVGCFSFQASKILPCGEGGAVVTNRDDVYDRLHAFQNNGRDRAKGTSNGYLHQGGNLRMTEFQAALLLAQLTRFEDQCAAREQNAQHLTSLLKEIPGCRVAALHDGCTRNTYYILMAHYDPQAFKGLSREGFLRALRREGIPCGAGYNPLNREPFLENILSSRAYRRIYSDARLKQWREANSCPVNERLSREGLFFSQTCLLGNKSDVEEIAAAVARIQKNGEEIARKLSSGV